MEWNTELVEFLQLLRKKSVYLSQQHTNSFFYFNNCSTMFQVPSIILSIFNSFISVGVTAFISQPDISITTSAISMLLAILGSISLYLNLNTQKIEELELSKAYHHLALNISKELYIPLELRKVEQIEFLNDCYDKYIILLQRSSLIRADEAQEQAIQKFSPKVSLQSRLKNPLLVNTIS
jgi:hypothetical protein